MKRWLALMGWLVALAAAIAGLHRLGGPFPSDLILGGGPLEPTLAAALRLAGLAVGYWLGASTLLYLLARAARLPRGIRAVRWATIGPIRQFVDRILAGALVATMSLPTAVGAMTLGGYVPIPAGDPVEAEPITNNDAWLEVDNHPSSGPSEDPATLFIPVLPVVGPQTPIPTAAGAEVTITVEAIEVVVRPGDHMWQLAEQRLTQIHGRPVIDSEIAPYWLKVVGTNVGKIKSGDPDLIFPGEVLVLPAIEK